MAPYATKSAESLGRLHPEEPHPLRSCFARDRDRILHSRCFRRLEYKTQVFVNGTADHYRTRLTHTMEMAAVGRTLARILKANEDLTECICLAHDIGHSPFGHAGEHVLDDLMKNNGGFDHNLQSLRSIEVIESPYPAFRGLNLTWEVRAGLLKHEAHIENAELDGHPIGPFQSLEAQIADIADDMTYHAHDVDDGIEAGIVTIQQLEQTEFWRLAASTTKARYPNLTEDQFIRATIRYLLEMQMLDVVEQGKESGLTRRDILYKLAGVDGVYVPMLYHPRYGDDGAVTGIDVDGGAPAPVKARYVDALKPEYYPDKPLVPLCEVVHDRLAVELMRGCTRGCRFCNAGTTYRPKRERPVEDVVNQIVSSIDSTGWEEIGLVSLSTSDYSGLETLVDRIGEELAEKTVSISLSSLRADNFSVGIAESAAGGRKSSLTFAPEAGTQRLRDVINKNITEEQLFETLTTAFRGGWKSFKLYFMISLPTETDEDIIAIAELLNRIHGLLRRFKGRRVNVTISSFSPKPQTPFQWESQDSVETIGGKIRLLKRNLKGKSIFIKTDNPVISMLECRLGRGGRNLGAVIFDAWQNGCRLDGWSERFNAEAWRAAFEKTGITLDNGSGEIAADSVLPWDHLSFDVEKPFLLKERGKAVNGECTPDCSDVCQGCGPYAPFCASLKKSAPQQTGPTVKTVLKSAEKEQMFGRRKRSIPGNGGRTFISDTKFRIKFAKTSSVRYIGHLDLVRQIDRAMRRAGIPIAYSQGFHPHPKISFCPPLALGMKSFAEYADFTLRVPFPDIENVLRSELSHGLDLIAIRPIPDTTESLNTIVLFSEYHVPAVIDSKLMDSVKQIIEREHIPVERYSKKGPKTVDIRPGIISIDIASGDTGLIILLSSAAGKTVKPSEIINLLFNGTIPDCVTRTEQYTEISGKRITPFEVVL